MKEKKTISIRLIYQFETRAFINMMNHIKIKSLVIKFYFHLFKFIHLL